MLGPALVTEFEWFDPVQQKSHTHREWVENGITQAYDFYLKVYSLDQYTSMLTQAGFLIRDRWGDFLGNPHNVGNSRTILVAEKLR